MSLDLGFLVSQAAFSRQYIMSQGGACKMEQLKVDNKVGTWYLRYLR
jgi:hypothetical protein